MGVMRGGWEIYFGVCVCARARVCVCVHVCVRARVHARALNPKMQSAGLPLTYRGAARNTVKIVFFFESCGIPTLNLRILRCFWISAVARAISAPRCMAMPMESTSYILPTYATVTSLAGSPASSAARSQCQQPRAVLSPAGPIIFGTPTSRHHLPGGGTEWSGRLLRFLLPKKQAEF